MNSCRKIAGKAPGAKCEAPGDSGTQYRAQGIADEVIANIPHDRELQAVHKGRTDRCSRRRFTLQAAIHIRQRECVLDIVEYVFSPAEPPKVLDAAIPEYIVGDREDDDVVMVALWCARQA